MNLITQFLHRINLWIATCIAILVLSQMFGDANCLVAQEDVHRQKERIIDEWCASWLESGIDTKPSSFRYGLSDIGEAYAEIGAVDKIKELLSKIETPKDEDEEEQLLECINTIHHHTALYFARSTSAAMAVEHLRTHVVDAGTYNLKENEICRGIIFVTEWLAENGKPDQAIEILKLEPKVTRSFTIASLASNGEFDKAYNLCKDVSNQHIRNDLLREALRGAVGTIEHARVRNVISEIEPAEAQDRVVLGCFRSLRDRWSNSGYDSKLFLQFCEQYGDRFPEECFKVTDGTFGPSSAHWKEAFDLSQKMYELKPETEWKAKLLHTRFRFHFWSNEFADAFNIVSPLIDDPKFSSELSFDELLSDLARSIIVYRSTEQIKEILDAFPWNNRDKVEFMVRLLKYATLPRLELHTSNAKSETRKKNSDEVLAKHRELLIRELSGVQELEGTWSTSLARKLRMDFHSSIYRMSKSGSNTGKVIELLAKLEQTIPELEADNLWDSVAVEAYEQGQMTEYIECLGHIPAGSHAIVELSALIAAGDRIAVLQKLDLILEEKEQPALQLPAKITRVDVAKHVLWMQSFKSSRHELLCDFWERISDKMSPERNAQFFRGILVDFNVARGENMELSLEILQRSERIAGIRNSPGAEIARCCIYLDAGKLELASETFTDLIESDADLSDCNFYHVFKRFVKEKHFQPIEKCVELRIDHSMKDAIDILRKHYVEQSNVDAAIKLADAISSPRKKCDYLEHLNRIWEVTPK